MAQLQLSADFARLLHSSVPPSLPPSYVCGVEVFSRKEQQPGVEFEGHVPGGVGAKNKKNKNMKK